MKRSSLLLLCCLPFLVALAASCQHEGNDSLAKQHRQDLTAVFDREIAACAAPGGVMAIRFADGSVLRHATGLARLAARRATAAPVAEPMSADMHYRVGSNTKTMTALIVLMLKDRGLLRLDDAVDQHLPGLLPRGGQITVRMLLEQTTGLFNYTNDEEAVEAFLITPQRMWTPEELLQAALGHEPLFAPGQEFHYCNTNYVVLGMLIEQLTGLTAEAAFWQFLFEPAGMTSSSLPSATEMPEPFMHGYLDLDFGNPVIGPEDDVTNASPTFYWTAGGVVSNLDDMLAYARVLFDGELLKDDSFKEQFPSPAEPGYGLGVSFLPDGTMGHNGVVLGYASTLYRFRDTDFILAANSQFYETSIDLIYDEVKRALFPDAPPAFPEETNGARQWTRTFF